MSDSAPRHLSLEQLRKQAKDLLRQYCAGEETARARFLSANPRRSSVHPASLVDAQFVIARDSGFETWADLKRHVEDFWRSRMEPYRKLAEDVAAVFQTGDTTALDRIHELLGELLGRNPSAGQLRAEVLRRLNSAPARNPGDTSLSLADARIFVARWYGFETWEALESSVSRPPSPSRPAVHGLSAAPPFYRILWKDNSIEPRPPLSDRDWDEIFEVMRGNRITGLRAGGQMTDAVLERLASLDLVTALHLEGSRRVTDLGLGHLARIPRLENLNLSGCSITDHGLAVLRHLPRLREFHLHHHAGVSDAGLANLAFCGQLERVDLLGSEAGDGVIRALTGKLSLRQFLSGNRVTDEGLPLLQDFPVFKAWQGREPEFSLMTFHAEPNLLLLRGRITKKGLASLVGLDGLFALNLDDSGLADPARDLRPLTALPNLGWLGFDATDETMGVIAAFPRLRMLMCQDTSASEAGFRDLSRSRTLEYIWGRRCYNLNGPGFASMAQMPSLRGLAVSCRNVEDSALAVLPEFPSLVEFMPMDVPDEGFRHLSRCDRLEALWCMYCRETGDEATTHLAGLPRLKTYYAGQTRITDRSLEIVSHMQSIERLIFSACPGVTNSGVAMLKALPRLRELSLENMPGVTRLAIASIPPHVRLNFET